MKKRLIGILAALTLCITALSGCIAGSQNLNNSLISNITVMAAEKESIGSVDTYISLEGSNVNINGKGAAVQDNKIVIAKGGTYSISGTLTDGQIVVNASNEEKVYLILNGVDITCSNSSAIYVKKSDKTIISMAEGTENKIRDGKEYVFEDENSDEPYAAIYSKSDLTIMGEGTLTVNGNYKEGITGKDALQIDGGTINVTSVDDGIKGRDSLIITDGTITVNSGNDGLKSNFDEEIQDGEEEKGYVLIEGGKINITSECDGIQGENNVYIKDGDIYIKSGGGSENAPEHTEEMPGRGMGGPGGRMGGPQGMAGKDGNMEPPTENHMQQNTDRPMEAANNTNTATAETSSESEESVSSKGIKAGTGIIVENGKINVDSCDDGIHSNDSVKIYGGAMEISSGDDGIHGDTLLEINDGTINVNKSYEGLEAETITINEGTIHVTASDDGINASGSSEESEITNKMQNINSSESGEKIQNNTATDSGQTKNRPQMPGGAMELSGTGVININGGYIIVNADGDGIDVNGSATMTGGTAIVYGPTNGGNGALDYDSAFEVTGGTLVAIGSVGMVQSPSDTSTENTLNITLSDMEAGSLIRIEDEEGNNVFTAAPPKKYSSVVICSPQINKDKTYKFYTGGTMNNAKEKDNIYEGGTYTKGTEVLSVKATDVITSAVQKGITARERGGGRGQGGSGFNRQHKMEYNITQNTEIN